MQSYERTAIYPGSFNPWHEGHTDILEKALKVFDKVIIAIGRNPDKATDTQVCPDLGLNFRSRLENGTVVIKRFDGLLVDVIKDTWANAVIRGLRNGHDLQYEMNQQYWNEDLGLKVPIVYFICDRNLQLWPASLSWQVL